MDEGFSKNDILNAGNPSTIASIFIGAELWKPPLNQSIRNALMDAHPKPFPHSLPALSSIDEKSWRRQTSNIINYLFESKTEAVQSIHKSIECFRQLAYRQASGNNALRQETDNYINGLYEWLKHGEEKGRLDVIETGRLITQRAGLIDKLSQTTSDNGSEQKDTGTDATTKENKHLVMAEQPLDSAPKCNDKNYIDQLNGELFFLEVPDYNRFFDLLCDATTEYIRKPPFPCCFSPFMLNDVEVLNLLAANTQHQCSFIETFLGELDNC